MTNKEAIECNKNLRMYMQITDKKSEHKFLKENYVALDMANKALEQELILDKIRADVNKLFVPLGDGSEEWRSYVNDTLLDVLEIINKYKVESEE